VVACRPRAQQSIGVPFSARSRKLAHRHWARRVFPLSGMRLCPVGLAIAVAEMIHYPDTGLGLVKLPEPKFREGLMKSIRISCLWALAPRLGLRSSAGHPLRCLILTGSTKLALEDGDYGQVGLTPL